MSTSASLADVMEADSGAEIFIPPLRTQSLSSLATTKKSVSKEEKI